MSKADEAPHQLSLAVWDVPSPIVAGRWSKVKIGAKCSAGCPLSDDEIEIRDHTGSQVAIGRLGPAPWPETSALYWAELNLIAPATDGMHSWTVRFAGAASELPHPAVSSNFGFITVEPPEHTVMIEVVEESTGAPIRGAELRLGVYRVSTGEAGIGTVELPKGSYDLNVWKVGYEPVSMAVKVVEDLNIRVEAVIAVEPEQAYWM